MRQVPVDLTPILLSMERSPMPRDPFPKVREAREALRAKALELYERHMALIEEAASKGEMEAALKASQWLLEHMPRGDNGETIIDESAAKPKEVEGRKGPQIKIGIALGGMPSTQPKVIDITPVEPDDHKD